MTSRRLQLDPLARHRTADERRSAGLARPGLEEPAGRGDADGRVRLVPAHLPGPIRRGRRRKEVIVRPAQAVDASACALVDGRYTTTHVWQLDARQEADELRISFRQVRLPRELTLDAPHHPPALRGGAQPKGLLWLVAEEVDVEGPPDTGARAGRPHQEAGETPALPDTGTIVGYVAAATAPGDANAFLRTLVVDRKHRRKGIAARLLVAAQRWSAAQGATGLMADVPARSYPALRLLQQAGFTFCGFNDRCYPDNEVALFLSCRLR